MRERHSDPVDQRFTRCHDHLPDRTPAIPAPATIC